MHTRTADLSRRRFELQQELLAMPEHKLLLELDGLQMSIWLFEQNFLELKSIISQILLAEQSLHLATPKNHRLFEMYIFELTRRLHNFVASVTSLVDHTRRLYRSNYKQSGLFPEYEAKVQSYFADWSLVQFVQGLREFMQHYKLPRIALETRVLNLQTEEMVHRLTIPKKNLLENGFKWNAKAREFIAGYGDNSVDLWQAVDNYHTHVLKFYEWFAIKQREIHRKEYSVVSRAQEKLLVVMADDVPNTISERLKFISRGLATPVSVLGVFLTREQDAEIAPLVAKPVEWTEAALQMIQKAVPLPSELVESIRQSVRPKAA